MNMFVRNKLLAYLAGATLSVSSGAAGAVPIDLTGVPSDMLDDLLTEAEGDDWNPADRLSMFSILAEDSRRRIRLHVSKALTPTARSENWDALEPVLLKLAGDPLPEVRNAVATATAHALWLSDRLVRTRVIAEWALSDSPEVRETIAKVLSHPFPCLGSGTATEHLAKDPYPEVRAAVAGAAIFRRQENPLHYQHLLEALSEDANPLVRRTAGVALGKASSEGAA